jgi:putative polyhydroxyalkanoate system protein
MAQLVIEEPHALAAAEAKSRLSSLEDHMRNYLVKAHWEGLRATIDGAGVSGTIEVSGSDVVITIKLGLLAVAAGVDPPRLERTIRRRIREAFDA